MVSRKLFVGIWVASIIGALAVLPYVSFLGVAAVANAPIRTCFVAAINAACVYGIICFMNYHLLQRIDVQPFRQQTLDTLIKQGMLWGDNNWWCFISY